MEDKDIKKDEPKECKECKEECKCDDCKEDCQCDDCKCKCEDENCKCEDCKECKEDCKCEECKDFEKMKQEIMQEKGERLALLAEFVNYKKRNEADKNEYIVYANSKLLKQIIEIVDDFDRALNVDIGENKITEGVIMIKRKLIDLLLSHGLSMLDVKVGDEFSPVNMEAVSSLPVKDIKKNNKVMEILQKGYINKQTGKTFKNAVVVIGKKS